MLISRCTDPANFELLGVPPKDLICAIAVALRRAGFDYDDVFQRCVSVSNEWNYNVVGDNVADRFSQRYLRQRSVPMRHKSLDEVLNPQPVAQKVRRNSCRSPISLISVGTRPHS